MTLLHVNALLALAAAFLWGGGDFSGGMGAKHAGGTMGGALRVILAEPCGQLYRAGRRGLCARGHVSAWRSAGLGNRSGRDGRARAGLLLCGAFAGSDGGFGGVERAAGGGDSGGGLGGGGRIAGAAPHRGISGGRSGDLADCGGTECRGQTGRRGHGVAGGGGGNRVWDLFCGAEDGRGRGRDLAHGHGEDGQPQRVLPDAAWAFVQRRRPRRSPRGG